MSTEPRTVRVNVLRTYRATVSEPDWCVGHGDDDAAQFRPDITHFGPEHRLTFNGEELLRVMLAQAPFARKSSRELCAYVEQAGYTASLDPASLYDLAAALDSAADQLRDFADQLTTLTSGEGDQR
ncbi:hypothetical protein [Streptomyces sp. NPDC091215]|uniref:DUF6907 domain-containing protein n=1 Tax=Streptomyces sp. NPDC091215 TaxID=3155192 RepID=UPI00344714CD